MDEDRKKYWTRPNEKILAEVLEKTIELDYMINKIIRDYFNLNIDFGEENRITNISKINNFGKFIFMDMGALAKFNLLKESRKEINEDEKTNISDFQNNFLRIYEIRNIFAHSLLPKKKGKEWLATPGEISWEELHKEHKRLTGEITLALLADH